MSCRPAGVYSDKSGKHKYGWEEEVPVEEIKGRALSFEQSARIGYLMHERNAGFIGRQMIYISEGQMPTCTIL